MLIGGIEALLKRIASWAKEHKPSFEIIESQISKNVPKLRIRLSSLLVGFMILTYTVVFSMLTILRNYSFQSFGYDFAIYMQMLYTTAFHGKLLGYTLEYTINPSSSFFGVHFSPLIFLLVPLYRVFPYADALLILQAFVVALGALVVYKLAMTKLGNNFASICLSAAYLLFTPLQIMNWVDFHLESFIPLLVLLSYYFYVKSNYITSFAFIVLTLSTFESMPVILFPLGIYVLVRRFKEKKAMIYASLIMVTCIAWFYTAISVMDVFNPSRHITYSYPWIQWGTTYPQVIITWLTKPLNTLNYLFAVNSLQKGGYILLLLVPLAFTPLFAPLELTLLVFPWLIISFLSSPVLVGDRYGAFIIAQVFVASIAGIPNIRKMKNRLRENRNQGLIATKSLFRTARVILLASIIIFLLTGPMSPVSQRFGLYPGGILKDDEHLQLLRNVIAMIPSNASVFTQNEIAPQLLLPNRLELYSYAHPPMPPLSQLKLPLVDYIILDVKLFGTSDIFNFINHFVSENNYSLIVNADGILVYEHSVEQLKLFKPYKSTFNYQNLTLRRGQIVNDPASISGKVFATNSEGDNGTAWFGSLNALPPGEYAVTFWLKPEKAVSGYLLTLGVTTDNGNTTLTKQRVYSYELNTEEYTPIGWKFFTNRIATNVQFNGSQVSNLTSIYLDFIEVQQLPPTAVTSSGYVSLDHSKLTIGCGAVEKWQKLDPNVELEKYASY